MDSSVRVGAGEFTKISSKMHEIFMQIIANFLRMQNLKSEK